MFYSDPYLEKETFLEESALTDYHTEFKVGMLIAEIEKVLLYFNNDQILKSIKVPMIGKISYEISQDRIYHNTMSIRMTGNFSEDFKTLTIAFNRMSKDDDNEPYADYGDSHINVFVKDISSQYVLDWIKIPFNANVLAHELTHFFDDIKQQDNFTNVSEIQRNSKKKGDFYNYYKDDFEINARYQQELRDVSEKIKSSTIRWNELWWPRTMLIRAEESANRVFDPELLYREFQGEGKSKDYESKRQRIKDRFKAIFNLFRLQLQEDMTNKITQETIEKKLDTVDKISRVYKFIPEWLVKEILRKQQNVLKDKKPI